jgi:hypothetical protein
MLGSRVLICRSMICGVISSSALFWHFEQQSTESVPAWQCESPSFCPPQINRLHMPIFLHLWNREWEDRPLIDGERAEGFLFFFPPASNNFSSRKVTSDPATTVVAGSLRNECTRKEPEAGMMLLLSFYLTDFLSFQERVIFFVSRQERNGAFVPSFAELSSETAKKGGFPWSFKETCFPNRNYCFP